MKRPRREGGGGEVALMAVITKAMGAFLVLVVIMLPDYVYVAVHGKQGASAQQMLDAASQQAKELEQALKNGDATPQDLAAMRQKLQDLDQTLTTLKDEVASLSNKLGQADAEIERQKKENEDLKAEVARLKDQVDRLKNGQPDAAAQQMLAAASQDADELEQGLKNGNMTPQDLAAMLQKLHDLDQTLAALKDEVASLSGKLRQANAEIERLKKENEDLKAEGDALKAEAAKLKDQVGELKNRPLKSTIVTLSWSGCYGAEIALYVQAKVDNRESPLPSRTAGKDLFWPGDGTDILAPQFALDHGAVWWSTTDQDVNQRLTIWAKLLNPLSMPHSIARQCKIFWVETSSAAKVSGSGWVLTDKAPIKIVDTVDVRADGSIDRVARSREEQLKLDNDAYSRPCAGLLCPFTSFTQSPIPEADERPLFLDHVKTYYDVGDAAGPVFDAIASGAISIDAGYRWLGLFPMVGADKVEASKPEDVVAARRALDQKGAPAIFADALLKRVAEKLVSAGPLADLVSPLPPFAAPAPTAPAPSPSPSDGASPTPAAGATRERVAALAWQSVKDGALTQAESDAIIAAVNGRTKPTDSDIDKRMTDMRLPAELAKLLKTLIKSGDVDMNALPTPLPSSKPASP